MLRHLRAFRDGIRHRRIARLHPLGRIPSDAYFGTEFSGRSV